MSGKVYVARVAEILLVEDSPADVRLTQEALGSTRVRKRLHVARDGVEAMQFLNREGELADAPTPDLVLLDLNLPRKDGRQVLREIKADEELCKIPVVILSTSTSPSDISDAYRSSANCYISKPVELADFLEALRSAEEFWFTTVHLPRSDPNAG